MRFELVFCTDLMKILRMYVDEAFLCTSIEYNLFGATEFIIMPSLFGNFQVYLVCEMLLGYNYF